jgi:hypothetical protein
LAEFVFAHAWGCGIEGVRLGIDVAAAVAVCWAEVGVFVGEDGAEVEW